MSVEVVSSSPQSLGIIPEGSESSVAVSTQGSPDFGAGMAVVQVEHRIDCALPVWGSVTDEAEAILFGHHDLEVGVGDSVLLFHEALSGLPLVSPGVLGSVDSAFFSMLFCVPLRSQLMSRKAAVDASIRPFVDRDDRPALTAVASHGVNVDFRDLVVGGQLTTASDAVGSVLPEVDSTASRAVGFFADHVDVRQDVLVTSGGMALQEANRFSLDPSTISGGLGSDASGSTASAVARPEGDSTVLGALTNLSHRKDCTSC